MFDSQVSLHHATMPGAGIVQFHAVKHLVTVLQVLAGHSGFKSVAVAKMMYFFLLLLVAGAKSQSSGYNFVCTFVDSLNCQQVDYKPVCANNGVEYKTECDFTKAHCKDVSLDIAYNGPCSSTLNPTGSTRPTTSAAPTTPKTTSADSTTLTASQNTTIDMLTTAAGVTATTASTVPTSTTVSSISAVCQVLVTTDCPADDSPICASDLISYSSLCEYTKAKCFNPSLTVVQSGPCTDISTPAPSVQDIICRAIESSICYDDGIVLCASDGITYGNSCDFERARCQNSALQVVKAGKC